MEKEIWKPINGYSKYEISNLGRIKNTHYVNHYLNGTTANTGYVVVGLYKNKKQKFFLLHRLLGEHFIPNPENKIQMNHKNGIKTDNRLENIEWVSGSQNTKHSYDNGLRKKTPPKRKQVNKTKVTKDGKLVGIFNSLGQACKKLKLHQGHAGSCARGELTQHKGYKLEYI
jgi:hypothetical protein